MMCITCNCTLAYVQELGCQTDKAGFEDNMLPPSLDCVSTGCQDFSGYEEGVQKKEHVSFRNFAAENMFECASRTWERVLHTSERSHRPVPRNRSCRVRSEQAARVPSAGPVRSEQAARVPSESRGHGGRLRARGC